MRTENDYKLDFVYKIDTIKYHLRDCEEFVLYGSIGNLLNNIFDKYVSQKKTDVIYKLLDYEDYAITQPQRYMGNDTELRNEFQKIVEGGPQAADMRKFYSLNYIYRVAMSAALKKTPEYAEVEAEFAKWLATRPGVSESWREYAAAFNRSSKDKTRLPLDLNLKTLSANTTNAYFRKCLENNRPDKFTPGQVVKLKDMYKMKRGKDPFFHKYDKSIRDSQRIGTVLKKTNSKNNYNYGVGSREVRVMWFMTGEETNVQEKCLSRVD